MRRALATRTRKGFAFAGLIVAAIALSAVLSGVLSDDGDGSSRAATSAAATTEILRQDLVEVETEQGTQGYGDEREVINRRSGTVTWLPDEGSAIAPDRVLFRVDGEPVILLDGSVPAYRDLDSAVGDGPDVTQLERNLRALGYDKGGDIDLDDSWDSGTSAAVLRWQEAHDLDETGVIELGRVVFQPGKRRVASLASTLGADTAGGGGPPGDSPPGDAVAATEAPPASNSAMTTTSTRPVVTVDLDTSKVALATRRTRVEVELSSGDDVRGRVTAVDSVASAPAGEQGVEQTASTDATVELTIRLRRAKGFLDQSPVIVNLERSRRRDVLSVPVTALLARDRGEFALEVRDGPSRRLVAVEPGLYAGGFVEVRGQGLRAGMAVTDARV